VPLFQVPSLLGFTQGLVLLPFFVSLVPFLRASLDVSAQKKIKMVYFRFAFAVTVAALLKAATADSSGLSIVVPGGSELWWGELYVYQRLNFKD